MTPTSATGRPEARAEAARRRASSGGARREGFTLVELMMTVTIIGLAAGAVVLAVPDPRPPVGAEAERFAARLVRAREEAVLSNRAVAVEVDGRGYGFASFDGVRWAPLTDGPFGPETWDEGTRLSGDGLSDGANPTRVVFDPTGVADPAVLTLSRAARSRTVTVDGAGEVTLDE